MPPAKLEAPTHFNKLQKAAWTELIATAPADQVTPTNRFIIEIAATLLAKFRAGKSMSATEMKELKKYLASFGLAKGDGGPSNKKPGKNSKYFGTGTQQQ